MVKSSVVCHNTLVSMSCCDSNQMEHNSVKGYIWKRGGKVSELISYMIIYSYAGVTLLYRENSCSQLILLIWLLIHWLWKIHGSDGFFGVSSCSKSWNKNVGVMSKACNMDPLLFCRKGKGETDWSGLWCISYIVIVPTLDPLYVKVWSKMDSLSIYIF